MLGVGIIHLFVHTTLIGCMTSVAISVVAGVSFVKLS